MKKIILTLALAALCISAFAIPARPLWFQGKSADGQTLELRLVGDEFGHAFADREGNIYLRDADGNMRPVDAAQLAEGRRKAMALRQHANIRRVRAVGNRAAKVSGSPKIPVLLVQFKDQKFKTTSQIDTRFPAYPGEPREVFANMLHQNGYSYNGATGSVLDFYIDNSNGVYNPVFDVLSVVTLDNNMATYGGNSNNNDIAPELAVYQAVKKLDDSVDFSQYDNDRDGYVDMILMYYAGFNEAEYGDEDTIWPHQWSIQESGQKEGNKYIGDVEFDGVRLANYFCTSELSSTGINNQNVANKGVLCGIGTTCHEFAHSLGLPDFYDTNYEDNGSAGGTYDYDTMCGGAYNNDGNTPPFFGAEELMMLGWMDSLTDLPAMGKVTLPAISKTERVAYKGPSTTDGEYFVFECRGSSSWDEYIPAGPGLIVYHVDKSNTKVYSNYTAFTLWDQWEASNSINAIGNHPCYYIIPAACQNYKADNTTTSNGYSGTPSPTTGLNYSGSNFAFGVGSYTSYTPVDWKQVTMDYTLSNISYDNDVVTFNTGKEICSIVAPSGTYTAGTPLTFSVEGAPSGAKVAWYWDDVALSGASVTPAAGFHTVEARVTSGKRTIRVELEVQVYE